MSAQTHAPDDSPLLDTDRAARYLGSNARTLERWRTEGTGPKFVKVGRRVHYRRATLDAWILQRERSNTRQRVA